MKKIVNWMSGSLKMLTNTLILKNLKILMIILKRISYQPKILMMDQLISLIASKI
jgi:hypothetical protein